MASIKDDLGAYLREQRQNARLSLRQLAELAEVSNPYLSQIERGLKKPSAEILQSLAKGLRVSAESLYVRAGILDERDEQQVDIEAAILSDSLLTERQKAVLLDIYESFRAENARSAAEADEITGARNPAGKPPVRQRAEKKAAAKTAKTAKKTAARATATATKKTTSRTSSATGRTTRTPAAGAGGPSTSNQTTSTSEKRSDS
ncbi:MAG TPA: helix-turn-helix transcriptional regulator [Actinomycetales bacterium]|nr:helix-turn-helix transcriptional regulator [Actinomycetales bacterium]